MLVEVSLGEALDKLTILLIKRDRIDDIVKKTEIQKEIDALSLSNYQKKYEYYIRLLRYFNEVIWDGMSILQTQCSDTVRLETSKRVFEFNDRRFRIKTLINTEEDSYIKEQKSYSKKHAVVNVDSLQGAIPIIHCILPQFCTVSLEGEYKGIIRNIIPLKKFTEDFGHGEKFSVSEFTTSEDLSIYDYQPIRYISGGQLGDFIHQLSVVHEMFLKTGRRGKLYIYNNSSDPFRQGIDTVYSETYPFVSKQPYILSYEKHSGEPFDIDLSSWRYRTQLYVSNWKSIFGTVYGVEWGKHPWLIGIDEDETYKDTIIVSHSSRRWDSRINYPEIITSLISTNIRVVFAQLGDTSEYTAFKQRTGANVECVQFGCIYDFLKALAACRVFVGNLSAPFTLAHAIDKKRIGILSNGPDDIHVEGLQTNFTSSRHYNKMILDLI